MLQVVEQLNREAKILNSQREQMIGRRDMAEKSYKEEVSDYLANYGVQINTSNIEEEYIKVKTMVKDSIEKLQSDITSIKNGDYKKETVVDVELDNVVIESVKEDATVPKLDEPIVSLNEEPKVEPKVEPITKSVEKPSIDEGFDNSKTEWGTTDNLNDKFSDLLNGSEFQL